MGSSARVAIWTTLCILVSSLDRAYHFLSRKIITASDSFGYFIIFYVDLSPTSGTETLGAHLAETQPPWQCEAEGICETCIRHRLRRLLAVSHQKPRRYQSVSVDARSSHSTNGCFLPSQTWILRTNQGSHEPAFVSRDAFAWRRESPKTSPTSFSLAEHAMVRVSARFFQHH